MSIRLDQLGKMFAPWLVVYLKPPVVQLIMVQFGPDFTIKAIHLNLHQ